MFEIKLPQVGQTMTDGTIVKWRKAVGDAVKAGEVLFEVETDKAVVEIESNASGSLLKILCPEGTTVGVHTPVALVGEPSEASTAGEAVSPTASAPTAAPAVASPAQLPPGVQAILMPKAGQSVEEAQVVAWRVKPGDRIKPGDVIFEVETDKATIEIEATDTGRVARIVVKEGETAEVLKPVAYLGEDDAVVDAYLAVLTAAPSPAATAGAASAGSPVAAAPGPRTPTTMSGGRPKASPAARNLAAQRGIDLATVGAGRGPGGRILSSDVPAQSSTEAVSSPAIEGGVRRRMSAMRRAIARNLLASKRDIPHFYMNMTIDAEPMMALYRQEKAKYPCSVNDVVTLACARVIAEFPAFRSQLDKDEVVEYPHANIGIAVGMDDGLVVPVLLAAEAMTLQELAAQTRRIAEAARAGKIEGMGQGVFTITNLGMFGVESFAAIINPPEASILAVGAVRDDVVVRDGQVRSGKVMTMTLSADHRLIDGLLAAKFLARLKDVLQNPGPMVG